MHMYNYISTIIFWNTSRI